MGQIEYFSEKTEKSENQELYGHFDFEEHHPSIFYSDKAGGTELSFNILPLIAIFSFKPLEDITAYELAKVLEIVIQYRSGYCMTRAEYDSLPEGVRRHLELAEESKGGGE